MIYILLGNLKHPFIHRYVGLANIKNKLQKISYTYQRNDKKTQKMDWWGAPPPRPPGKILLFQMF